MGYALTGIRVPDVLTDLPGIKVYDPGRITRTQARPRAVHDLTRDFADFQLRHIVALRLSKCGGASSNPARGTAASRSDRFGQHWGNTRTESRRS